MKTVLILAFLLAAAMAVSARGSLLESVLQEMKADSKQDDDHAGDGEETALAEGYSIHSEEELLAQTMCQFSANTEGIGRVYAVGRACSRRSKTCNEICKDYKLTSQDYQTRRHTWFCVGAYHVYRSRPKTNPNGDVGSAKLGLKSAKTYCDTRHCGPNFCCCFARYGGAIE